MGWVEHAGMVTAGEIRLHNRPFDNNLNEAITSATWDSSVDQVSQLTIELDDPNFSILNSGVFSRRTPISFNGSNLIVAAVETNDGSGLGGLSVSCRPDTIDKLKQLRGKKVRTNISPSTFVGSECAAAGVPIGIIQPGAKRKKVSRDVKQKGDYYDQDAMPSAWTTITRLASELGYLAYESNNKLYFGTPKFLADNMPSFTVQWDKSSGVTTTETQVNPICRWSIDSEDTEVEVNIPLVHAGSAQIGSRLILQGFPEFSGSYFLSGVSYPVAGTGWYTITATTLRNPHPSGDPDKKKKSKSKKKAARKK